MIQITSNEDFGVAIQEAQPLRDAFGTKIDEYKGKEALLKMFDNLFLMNNDFDLKSESRQNLQNIARQVKSVAEIGGGGRLFYNADKVRKAAAFVLTAAIQYKQNYYQETRVGKIKRFFLKFFDPFFHGWNRGETAAIKEARDILEENFPPLKNLNLDLLDVKSLDLDFLRSKTADSE